ncbi:MAG: VWA domain-containing protein [Acidobacteriota bacterium]|nr:VWA domain-containing protein [Acidobacteriota bacterium]
MDSSIVIVNAMITDAKGKPAAGLKQNQFKLFVDGAEQEILSFTTETTPFAAVILLDTSGSMEQRISLARSAAMQFLDGLRTDDLTAVYNFDSKVSLIQDFSNSRDIAPSAFELKAYGMTVLNDAIYKAAQELANRPEKRRAIIVLSDGADTKSARSADKALKAALSANATIYTVDMSAVDTNGKERMQNQGVLKNFAEKSGGRFIPTPGGIAMREAFKNIVAELGRQYTLSFQPPESKNDGKWHTIELKHSNPELTVRTRKGYNAPKK